MSAKRELTSDKSVNAICKLNKDLLNYEKEEFQVSKGCFYFSKGAVTDLLSKYVITFLWPLTIKDIAKQISTC